MSALPIDRHGIVGDMSTVALVGTDGCIDFMCFPRFDSPSIFARLLDDERGGCFAIEPVLGNPQCRQMYLPDTNVLFTRALSSEGVAEISDHMDVEPGVQRLVRRVKTVRGEITYRVHCEPRMNYARDEHAVEINRDGALFVSRAPGGLALRLRSDQPLEARGPAAAATFVLRAGQSATFILEDARSGELGAASNRNYSAASFKRTSNYWRSWIGRSTYRGRWREAVNRAALTLKLLTSRAHGSIVASPTFGLPERVGGGRNWDYRYTWIRDGSFTLYALMRLGYTEEAGAFMSWIEARCCELDPDGAMPIMYGLDGRRNLVEEELPHLRGYMGSSPVRIGNAAWNQLQLDIHGELLDSVYLYDKYGTPISYDLWMNLRRLVDWVCDNWQRPDEGIWEVRGGRKEFLFSRVMCWAAIDRAIRLATKRAFPAPIDRWRDTRDAIHRDVFAVFWNPKRCTFVQHRGATNTDASLLMLPLVKFISPTDPRWLSTLAAIEADLVEDSLVYRYRLKDAAPDGLPGEEGTFCICSFWYAECLARSGDLDKARYFFEKTLAYANHLGLFPEELGPSGEHLGNFPQALTHIGLISAAFHLDRTLSERD
jgi:GH15 family glucan-1,4-alpha-glucosidase